MDGQEPTGAMPTPHTAFERRLAEARVGCSSELAGLFGPGSMTWQVNREAVVILGGGAASLLQAAHPYVAHAVVEHSAALTDARGRLRRTLLAVYEIVFGDWSSAALTARRVRAIHDTVTGHIEEDVGRYRRGERYHANDADAQRWVAATLMYTAVQVYELTVRRLRRREKDRLAREHARFCAMFGIPAALCQPDWASFMAYWDQMIASNALGVGRHARHIAADIMYAPDRARWPFYRWLRGFTGALLPPRFCRAYALPEGFSERALASASIRALRGSRWMPPLLRYFPGYLDARRRLTGRPGPDPRSAALWNAFLATVLPPTAEASPGRPSHTTAAPMP